MPRIAGVDIPADKPVWVSLGYIYGVGPTNSRVILKEAGIEPTRRAKELSEEELAKIIGILDKGFLVEGAFAATSSRTSHVFAISAAIAATAIAARCPSADNAPVPTPAPEKGRERPSPERRASRNSASKVS